MARTIAAIYNQMTTDYAANAAAAGITINPAAWSMFNLQRLMFYTIAAAIAIFEQLQDAYKTQLETAIATSPSGHPQWLQSKIYAFQYDANTPQVIQLNTDNQTFCYPTPNTALCIVTRCSVITDTLNRVNIKVAKNTTSAPLDPQEISALQDYINTIGFAGITYTILSTPSDQLFIEADISYQGQYNKNIVLTNVTNAINACLAGIPFNGVLKISELAGAIKGAAGVNDLLLKNVKGSCNCYPVYQRNLPGTKPNREYDQLAHISRLHNNRNNTRKRPAKHFKLHL